MLNKLSKFHIFLIIGYYVPSCFSSCFYEGQLYDEGKSWNASCNVCSCHLDAVTCTKRVCAAVSCGAGEILTHLPNECCAQCLPYKKPCIIETTTYAHNDVWSFDSKCIFYQCQDGSSVPFIIQCPSIVCAKGETLFTGPGKCCPKCVFAECEENAVSQVINADGPAAKCTPDINITQSCESKSELKQNLKWENPCAFCITENSEVNCYSQLCRGCSSNNNDVCCACSQDSCAQDCLKCSDHDTNYCTHCKNSSKVIHNGKCVEKCPRAFFKNENMHCRACPPNCKTCFGNMTSQCSSCKSGYFLQKASCVKNCDVNFYESGDHCFECHKSCSSCIGPSDEDCIACTLSEQLLQNGKCVDNCEGHFYVSDGYCLACNESCVRCLKDGSCQYCEEGFYLQDGLCLPECFPGYYTFMDAYCLSCHEECQECFGPLPYQCSSCPFNQYLQQNSCVWDCGQGFFGDLGAGLCRPCHSKCRACLGGSSEDKCLSCSSGYLLPYIGTHFGSCVEKCPDQYYLMESGVCGSCHETCERCFGPNETECISCNNTLFFKNGACVPHCSTGYFEYVGVCYACHLSCATCHGFTENDCYTCPHGRKKNKYGQCISTCGEGKYLDFNDNCIDCHQSCYDCLLSPGENKTIQCAKCKNQQHVIYKDECILECPSDFYMNSYFTCTECHPSCATCERTGATSCASCFDGNFLTHLGTCESQCHQGYFSSNGICEACNSNCHDCTSIKECNKCKGDLVVQFGECVASCSGHFYLDTVTRQCKECSKECKSCRGPLASDCTSCEAGKLFEDGVCVDICSSGFYQKENICQTCNLKCKTCSNLNTCTSCDPYFLHKNECVDDCGAGYYSDFETRECKDCKSGCVSCISPDYCTLCLEGYYLFNFECVTHCPPEYNSDPLWRLCKRNTDAPVLNANSTLKFQLKSKILISASFLSVSDEDSDSLLINISDQPSNGFLLKMSEKGEEIKLSTGENFTSSELKDGWIFFQHLQGIPLNGNINLKASDGHFLGNEVILPLYISSEFAPTIVQTKDIVLAEGSVVTLNSSILEINDSDNLNDVSLRLVEAPCSGKLVLLPEEKDVLTFSYEDFLQSKVALKVSKKPLKYDDKFLLQIFDGYNSVVSEIKVYILPEEQREIFLLRNKPLIVKFDELTKIDAEHLYVIGENLSPTDVAFSIEKSSINTLGNFFKFTTNAGKKKNLSSEKISFTQSDVNEGIIFYRHFDNTSTNFDIKMKVKNKKSGADLNFNFAMQVVKLDDTLSNDLNQFGMMVLQNHPATITNDHLQIPFNSIPANDIVYMITKKLAKDEGFLESLDKPGHRLQSFSQAEVDNLKIVYHPPPLIDSSETNYIFQFIVLDAKRKVQLSPVQNFTITVRPQFIEFTSPSTAVDNEIPVRVSQGQSVKLDHNNLLPATAHHFSKDVFELILIQDSKHGNLTQNGIKVEEGDGFSFNDDVYYIHDGSNEFGDYSILQIMGGPYPAPDGLLNKINFVVIPNDRESPVILDSTSLMGTVTEGKYLDLKRGNLAYTDLVSGDPDIVFTLQEELKYGKLSKLVGGNYESLKISDTFTQQDINDMLIRYTANENIGNNTVKDFLSFDVSDGSGNIQPNQALTMKVKPKIRQPPVVTITSDVKVNEGGDAVIEHRVITVYDPDSTVSDFKVFIEKQPNYGFLENSRPIPGTEKGGLAGIPISSFSYNDLVEGYIKYIQFTHRNFEPEKDTVYIRISDGYLSSPVHLVNITIKPMNDETPELYTHSVSLLQGKMAKITNSSLSVSDADTSANQLYIQLDKSPLKGTIRLLASNNYNFKNSKIFSRHDTFTFQDVLNGLILYIHEDSKSDQNDSFAFTVSDGHHFISGSIDIHIIVKDIEVPYLIRNLGLELLPGQSSVIDNNILSAMDSDSSVKLLKYILTSDSLFGDLFFKESGRSEKLSSLFTSSGQNYFTQSDIDNGKLFYQHYGANPVGIHYFKFNVIDPANNTLLDQKFFISVAEDLFPPIITHNTGIAVEEKSLACINSSMLAAIDEHQKDKDLVFSLTSLPTYGYLEMKKELGKPITNFSMSDLNRAQVCYVHKSEKFSSRDRFTFRVSDGKFNILQTFNINITTSFNAVPFVKIYPLSTEEGSLKTITEFEIDIFDRDTPDSQLIVSIISPPKNGKILNMSKTPLLQFSRDDLRQGLVSYAHDDTDTVADNFTFIITDGINQEFSYSDKNGINISTKHPIVFPIKVFPVDDTFPVLLKNEGIQVFKNESGKIWHVISKDILFTGDTDTRKENILYHVTLQPRFGFLELADKPNVKISQFTQENIDKNELAYVLKNDNYSATEDNFMFSVEDTKPNKVSNNIFVIHWARISFNSSIYHASEIGGLIELPVIRTGNKNLDFIATCKIEDANSVNTIVAVVDEIHFREDEKIKFCIFRVIDNDVFDGNKKVKVSLESNVSLLASHQIAAIYISDEEDEPIISFKESVYKTNETDEYVKFPVIREGDLQQELSVLCSTSDLTAKGTNGSSLQTGSDFRSRDLAIDSYITFKPGVSEVMCIVKIIDDNIYEEEEEFLLLLSEPHPVGKIAKTIKAHVIIQGPNDVPRIFIDDKKYEIFVGEQNSSVIILRQGGDLTKTCSVWCGSVLTSSEKKDEVLNSYYQINFKSFETSAVCFVKVDAMKLKMNTSQTLDIFIDSPDRCVIDKPNKVTAILKKKIIYPVIEFQVNNITVQENAGLVHIPVIRTGDVTNKTTIRCITQDGTAHAREDYQERYETRRTSAMHFNPGQKESFCPLTIYDDNLYEGSETFRVVLLPLEREIEFVTIGKRNTVTVNIIDSEDVTIIELEKPHYLVSQSSFPNSTTSAVITVIRHGDVSLLSKVRISTIDGSASSGLDYYAKSKLISLYPGEEKKSFKIEILYNRRRNWALSFTVILGPDEAVNAEIGGKSKTMVTIPRVQSTESLILPSVPIVVSLVDYDNVKKSIIQDAKSGYPLVCITPCDINYPDYAVTSTLCRESGINVSSIKYSWEIAMPLSNEKISPFEKITDSTLFTSAYHRVLDSVYFRPHERVRCIAQPVDSKGQFGIPLRSKSVKISSESGFCLTPSKMQNLMSSVSSQPFIATLGYINSSDAHHPNKLHIHIEIPHENGLLPLISTYPLHNVEFLLVENIYRQQHVCSNLLQAVGKSFLKSSHPQLSDVKAAFPHHAELVGKEMQLIYQHLDLKKCKWSFDAWYSMSDLVELCGGTVVSDFKVRDSDRTYISVLLPFYVTYIFAAAPTGWTSVEHHTEIEFSFFYETFLWKGGSHADDSLNASLSIVRIGTETSGHLFFEFKTVAKFYGCFVLEHHTLPGIKSHLTVPDGLNVKFSLELLWSEQTFDGPIQFWKATSNYNLKDYSGKYEVHLMPCEVSHTEQFSMQTGLQFLPCIARVPQKFDLPITFQQTLRPEPVTYALETFFQLFNDESLFLLNPFENYLNFQYIEYKGAFSKGENVYGRVFWSPEQELESAYQLKINEVLLCTGKNGFVPLYDPTGNIYGKGPQYGCLIPNRNLRQKFTLLNRHNPDAVDEVFQGLSFNAKFIEDSEEYTKLSQIAGVDGFVFKTDPLYEVSSSQQWFLQVTYSIKPTRALRLRRSSDNSNGTSLDENRTSIKMIFLNIDGGKKFHLQSNSKTTAEQEFGAHHVMYMISAILIILGILLIVYKNPKIAHHNTSKFFERRFMWINFSGKTSTIESDKCLKIVECKQKIKQTEKCKIRVYSPPKISNFTVDNSIGTEV